MKARSGLIRFPALLLVLCLLPITILAGSGGVADSSALAYERGVQMLTTSSLTDRDLLEVIRMQFEQAGSFLFGEEYRSYAEALMILRDEDAGRYDIALNILRRLDKNEGFTANYSLYRDKFGQMILPKLENLIQYISARKLEAYGDLEGAIALYDAFPLLDAVTRAVSLSNSLSEEKYGRAIGLLRENSLVSCEEASVLLQELGDYRDSPQRLKECRERIEALAPPEPTPALETINHAETASADAAAKMGELLAQLDAAKASMEAAAAEATQKEAGLQQQLADAAVQLKETNAKTLGLKLLMENAQKAKDDAEGKSAELLGMVDSMTTEKSQLTMDLASAGEAMTALDAKLAEATVQINDLAARFTLATDHSSEMEVKLAAAEQRTVDLEAAMAEAETRSAVPAVKCGLGMVTSIGSLADATADKKGQAQVNTTVCSLALDAQGKIQSVSWDTQQTKIQFNVKGKLTVPEPESLLTKIEKGDAYGMKKASALGKEWYEQIAAFEAYCVGKTVEEVLAIEVFQRDENHKAVPAEGDLKATVTITVGEYLASLQKAAANVD